MEIYIFTAGFVPGSREIPLKDLAEVEIYFVRGVHLNGDRYFIQFVRKRVGASRFSSEKQG